MEIAGYLLILLVVEALRSKKHLVEICGVIHATAASTLKSGSYKHKGPHSHFRGMIKVESAASEAQITFTH